jgi:hypothetical protein
MHENDHFTKTGSGKTWGKLKKETVFSQAKAEATGGPKRTTTAAF